MLLKYVNVMSWFNTLFKKKNVMGNDDHYIMKLCVGEEIYDIEDFNLQFKRDTCNLSVILIVSVFRKGKHTVVSLCVCYRECLVIPC